MASERASSLPELADNIVDAAVVDYLRDRASRSEGAQSLLCGLSATRKGVRPWLDPHVAPECVAALDKGMTEQMWVVERTLWMLVARGLVVPISGSLEKFRVTVAGMRMLREQHPGPLSPGYLAALTSRGVSDEAADRIEDAVECWRAHLDRAAIVMLGVAYEDVTIDVFADLGKADPGNHSARLDKLCRDVNDKMQARDRPPLLAALAEAAALNRRRHGGAHARLQAPSHADVEAHLRIAREHLPALRRTATKIAGT